MVGSPASQLSELCLGDGAVPERIREVAPFLEDLPATKQAHLELPSEYSFGWETAARHVLDCATRPYGSAGFDEYTSTFVRVCLGLESALGSFQQRMNDLANNHPHFRYPTKSDTYRAKRIEAMKILAAHLIQLEDYPCSRLRLIRSAEKLSALMRGFSKYELGDLSDEERKKFFRDNLREFVNLWKFFDTHRPNMSDSERVKTTLQMVSNGPYREYYQTLRRKYHDQIMRPHEVVGIFKENASVYDFELPKVSRTLIVIENIIRAAEEQNSWESVLKGVAQRKNSLRSMRAGDDGGDG